MDRKRSSMKSKRPHPPAPSSQRNSNPNPGHDPDKNSLDHHKPPIPVVRGYREKIYHWSELTEEKMKEVVVSCLFSLYTEALGKLHDMGYDEDTVMDAVLRSSHCIGNNNVVTNIVQSSMAYLISKHGGNKGAHGGIGGNHADSDGEYKFIYTDFRLFVERTASRLILFLMERRPGLTTQDAMCCLFMSDMHLGRASRIEVPCAVMQTDKTSPTRTNVESQAEYSDLLSKIEDARLDDNSQAALVTRKEQVSGSLYHQVRYLEKQLEDTKKWPPQKVIWADRRASSNMSELITERSENDIINIEKLKKKKETLEEILRKKFSEMEAELKRVTAVIESVNAITERMEKENAEMRASESQKSMCEIEKRRKKALKKLSKVGKEKAKTEEEIAEVKEEIAAEQQELALVRPAIEEEEAKWIQTRAG